MPGGSGGAGDTSTSTTTEPWDKQKYYLTRVFREAAKNYKEPLSYYPGETVAGFAPETEQSLASQTQRAQEGSPLIDASQQQLQSTIGGDYLSAGNPYFEQMAGRVRGQVQPQIESRFAASGAAGSPLANRALGLGLGDALGGLAYQNYGDERQRQLQGTLLAPQAAQQDYFDIAKLAEVGGAKEGLEQQRIDEAVARHEFDQMEPWQRLSLFNQMLQGGYGQMSSGTVKSGGGRSAIGAGLTGGLGGAASGAALGTMITPGVGTAVGAGLGGALGLLSGF